MRLMSEQWWQSDADNVHEDLHATMMSIRDAQASRLDEIDFMRELYGARYDGPMGTMSVFNAADSSAPPLPINLIAEVVDAYVAIVARTMPRMVFVPIDGSWKIRRKAELRTRFLDGVAYETKFRKDARKIARDAAMLGTGSIKVYHDGTKVRHWVTRLEEWWVDDLDARDGEPTCRYQRRYVDRHRLAHAFPAHRELILEARVGTTADDRWSGYDSRADQVLVTEGWHLRSGEGAKDGRHVIAVDTVSLLDEEWSWDRFPVADLQFDPPVTGYWSQGIVERLYGPQAAINDTVEQILANHRQFGKPRIYVARGSRVNPNDFTDGLDAEIIYYTGQAPIIGTAVAVSSDAYNSINMWRDAGYRSVGLPDGGAHGEVPRGIESGVALRTASDIKTARHALAGQALEDWRGDVAELDLLVAGELAKTKGGYSTVYTGRKYGRMQGQRVDYWEPAEGEEYVLRAYPTGMLPETPAGKLALLGELEDRGYLAPDEVMDLLDVPDVDRAVDSRTAGLRAIEWSLEQIMGDGIYIAPEPYLPLQIALVKGRDAYNLGRQDGVPWERLAMVQQWIEEVQAMMGPPPEQQAPQPAEAGMVQQ